QPGLGWGLDPEFSDKYRVDAGTRLTAWSDLLIGRSHAERGDDRSPNLARGGRPVEVRRVWTLSSDPFHRVHHEPSGPRFPKVVKEHRPGPYRGQRVGDPATGNIGGLSVDRLEHRGT